ncbi:unnamed protein product [Rotaria sordida]|uniref:Uncharacterized protein n=1 Tax=Rotaria sordida TaxID=392033 RepID=A0A814BMN3_9BILA|nr:unnamed protein product [Rotaria sordida]
MILDKKLIGILDQGSSNIVIFDETPSDTQYQDALNETQLLKYEIGGNQKINLVYQKPVVQLVYECYRNNDNLIFENKNFREGSIEVDMKKFMKPNGSECHKRQTGDHILRYHHTDNYNHVGIIRYSRVKCRKYINILRDTQFVHNNTILQSYNQDFIRTLVVIEFDKAVSLNDFPVRSAGIVVTCYQLCIIMVIS